MDDRPSAERVRYSRASGAARDERVDAQTRWVVIGLAATLFGYPLGLILVASNAQDWWTPAYVVLTLLALVAAAVFAGWVKHRRRVPRT